MVGVKCHQLLREMHKNRLKNFFKLPLASSFLKDNDSDSEMSVLKGTLDFYRHLVVKDVLSAKLRSLVDQNPSAFAFHNLRPDAPNIAAFDLIYDQRYVHASI